MGVIPGVIGCNPAPLDDGQWKIPPMRALQKRAGNGVHTAGGASSKLALSTKIFVCIQWLSIFHPAKIRTWGKLGAMRFLFHRLASTRRPLSAAVFTSRWRRSRLTFFSFAFSATASYTALF